MRKPSDRGKSISPEEKEFLYRRRAELTCFEEVLGAQRVIEADEPGKPGRTYHRWADEEFPAAVPHGRENNDWGWAVGYGGPLFTEDLNEVALLEAALKESGLQAHYLEALGSFLGLNPGDASPESIFELVKAEAETRVLAVLAAFERGRQEGRI